MDMGKGKVGHSRHQGWIDHSSTRALPEGPGSVGSPMRCPCIFHWLFHRLFLGVGEDTGAP
ncbi:unnamed protein product [Staurois parvus]|uniref:Uncharacterized protein n=1 Tax=Staurois parvus TaxID=386267 RepID=A0ABN9FE38_9NEOB|nr:unnamed protein product [Staurois parvus]